MTSAASYPGELAWLAGEPRSRSLTSAESSERHSDDHVRGLYVILGRGRKGWQAARCGAHSCAVNTGGPSACVRRGSGVGDTFTGHRPRLRHRQLPVVAGSQDIAAQFCLILMFPDRVKYDNCVAVAIVRDFV